MEGRDRWTRPVDDYIFRAGWAADVGTPLTPGLSRLTILHFGLFPLVPFSFFVFTTYVPHPFPPFCCFCCCPCSALIPQTALLACLLTCFPCFNCWFCLKLLALNCIQHHTPSHARCSHTHMPIYTYIIKDPVLLEWSFYISLYWSVLDLILHLDLHLLDTLLSPFDCLLACCCLSLHSVLFMRACACVCGVVLLLPAVFSRVYGHAFPSPDHRSLRVDISIVFSAGWAVCVLLGKRLEKICILRWWLALFLFRWLRASRHLLRLRSGCFWCWAWGICD